MQATLEQSVPALARAPVSGVATKSLLITWARRLLTMTVLLTPFAALALILSEVVVDGYSWKPMVLAVAFYVLTAHGVTIGFHRLFIRWFERLGWATGVRWPQPVLLATRRVTR
jgi:stearoyl-CoA desaturase (delta-9 desaturase)